MNKIRLENGAEYDVEYCGASEGVLSFTIPHALSVLDAAQAFGDASATKKIKYLIDNPASPDDPTVAAVHENYTLLLGVLLNTRTFYPMIQLQKQENE